MVLLTMTEIDTVGNENNDVTDHGGMRLVVAGNVVQLGKGNFSKIDGGWNVWATINSSAIQSISPNTPWYFEARDRSGNLRSHVRQHFRELPTVVRSVR